MALVEPFVGVALWTWISVMNPHRMTWGFAFNFPFAQVVALVTLAGLAVSWRKLKLPIKPLTVTLFLFWLWMSLSYLLAFHVAASTDMYLRITKTLLMTFVALAAVRSEKQIRIFVWIFTLSVIFFGVKGGIFTIVTGGASRVYGPADSHIADNNAISVALVMMIPLAYFLFQESKRTIVRLALLAAILLSAIAVLGSYSRGAFVAISSMLVFLIWHSRRRVAFLVVAAAIAPALLMVMPDKWFDRIHSISNYANDGSVLGRFNAWSMAWNLALDRPFTGGGFAVYEPDIFARYAPVPKDIHSAHSIYFQMLGEHGFVGLALFLALGFMMWRTANQVIRQSREHQETRWRANLASAIKVSIIGFAVGGITVNIGYWDVVYYELVLMVALQQLCLDEAEARTRRVARAAPGTITGALPAGDEIEPALPAGATQARQSARDAMGLPATAPRQ
jgi:probable O-glycosylation ligase (exosortase A-associated)